MPSPITTSGFHVTAQPGINYLDPRLLTPAYGNIVPSVTQGMQAYGQFQQLQDEAAMRPIRAQLAQIQLQQQQDALAQAPLRRQLAQIQLAEAQQNAAVPRVLSGNVSLEESGVSSPHDMPALDEAGNRTGPMGDLVQITEENLYGPGGTVTPRTVRKVVKTAADRLADEEKRAANIRASDALATSRTRGKDFESTSLIELYNNAVEEGDTEAAQLYKARFDALNTRKPTLTAEDFYDRRVAQLAADAGITYDKAMQLSRTPTGSEALATAATANRAAAKSQFMAPKLSAEQKAMIRGDEAAMPVADFSARIGDALGGKPAANIPTLTVAEAKVAPVGIIFIGIDGKKRKKNPDGTVSLIVE